MSGVRSGFKCLGTVTPSDLGGWVHFCFNVYKAGSLCGMGMASPPVQGRGLWQCTPSLATPSTGTSTL